MRSSAMNIGFGGASQTNQMIYIYVYIYIYIYILVHVLTPNKGQRTVVIYYILSQDTHFAQHESVHLLRAKL